VARGLEKGIRKTPWGWRAYGRVNGVFFSKSFPPETSLKVLKDWRHDERTRIRARQLARAPADPTGSLAGDVATYLGIVRAMPTLAQRTYDLQCWVTALGGDRPRRSVTAPELLRILHAWRVSGLAPGTCNRRRTALMHCWHVLDGQSAPNPLRDVKRFQEPDAQPRGRSYAQIERIFRGMAPSKTRARLKAIAYIGLAHSELKRIRPVEHWNRAAGTLVITGRAKGEGTPTRVVKLTQRGAAALRELQRTHAWGWFSNSTLSRRWRAALARVRQTDPTLPPIRPYDLRHSFATQLYRVSGDVQAVKEYLGHRSVKTAERYMRAGVSDRVARAVDAFDAAVGRTAKRGAVS
jgi:integrase